MECYNNKRRKLLKIHFFINLRKKIIFLRPHFCVIKQNLENIVEFLWKSPKTVTYSLTNNISHDHIWYSMCNGNMLIIGTICIIVHGVLIFYGLRSHRKLINLLRIARRKPLRGEVYNLSLITIKFIRIFRNNRLTIPFESESEWQEIMAENRRHQRQRNKPLRFNDDEVNI